MRVLVTGGTGVLGRAFRPLAETAGHDVRAPGRAELDLFDPVAVASAVRDVNAVLHLATRIQPLAQMQERDHAYMAQQNAGAHAQAQMEHQHLQQTQFMQQRHAQEMQNLRGPPQHSAPPPRSPPPRPK